MLRLQDAQEPFLPFQPIKQVQAIPKIKTALIAKKNHALGFPEGFMIKQMAEIHKIYPYVTKSVVGLTIFDRKKINA